MKPSKNKRASKYARKTFKLVTLVANGVEFTMGENVIREFRLYISEAWLAGYAAGKADARKESSDETAST